MYRAFLLRHFLLLYWICNNEGCCLAHCSIFDKSLSNAIDLGENFYMNSRFLANIDKNLDFLGHTSMKYILNKILDLTKKNHQMALLVRKIENKCKSKDISTRESLLGMSGVSRNQKLSPKYDFYSLKVSHQVLIE